MYAGVPSTWPLIVRFFGGTSEVVELVGERAALDELHGEKGHPVRFAHVVDGDDVGVAELGGQARLAQEAVLGVAAFQLGGLDLLEGDGALELGVPGLPDHAHASGADGGDEPVAAEGRAGVRQRRARPRRAGRLRGRVRGSAHDRVPLPARGRADARLGRARARGGRRVAGEGLRGIAGGREVGGRHVRKDTKWQMHGQAGRDDNGG